MRKMDSLVSGNEVFGSDNHDYLGSRLRGGFSRLIDYEVFADQLSFNHDEFVNWLRDTDYRLNIDQELLLLSPSDAVDRAANQIFAGRIQKVIKYGSGSFLLLAKLLSRRWDYYLVDYKLSSMISDDQSEDNYLPVLSEYIDIHLSQALSFADMVNRLYKYLPRLARTIDRVENTYRRDLLKSVLSSLVDYHYHIELQEYLSHFSGRYHDVYQEYLAEELYRYHLHLVLQLMQSEKEGEWNQIIEDITIDHPSSILVKSLLEEGTLNRSAGMFTRVLTPYQDQEEIHASISEIKTSIDQLFLDRQCRKKYSGNIPSLLVAYYWMVYRELHNVQVINHGLEKRLYRNEIEELLR